MGDASSVVPLESVVMKDSLSYEDVQFEILDCQVKRLINKEVLSFKVLRRIKFVEGATWEEEELMKA